MIYKNTNNYPFTIGLFILLLLNGCTLTTGVFEKDIAIPGQHWNSDFKPQVDFAIEDTTALYNIYLVLRHGDSYNYNNIWIRATVLEPGAKSGRSQQYDITLANNEKGWLGSAMDDIYEHRALIQPQTRFAKAGSYHFTLEQIMREDPLQHILYAGVRVEKIQ